MDKDQNSCCTTTKTLFVFLTGVGIEYHPYHRKILKPKRCQTGSKTGFNTKWARRLRSFQKVIGEMERESFFNSLS